MLLEQTHVAARRHSQCKAKVHHKDLTRVSNKSSSICFSNALDGMYVMLLGAMISYTVLLEQSKLQVTTNAKHKHITKTYVYCKQAARSNTCYMLHVTTVLTSFTRSILSVLPHSTKSKIQNSTNDNEISFAA